MRLLPSFQVRSIKLPHALVVCSPKPCELRLTLGRSRLSLRSYGRPSQPTRAANPCKETPCQSPAPYSSRSRFQALSGVTERLILRTSSLRRFPSFFDASTT